MFLDGLTRYFWCCTSRSNMKFFYLSTAPNQEGFFEIHEKECEYIPDSLDRDYLGPFNNGMEALRSAVIRNPKSTLCSHCCANITAPIIFSRKTKEHSAE